ERHHGAVMIRFLFSVWFLALMVVCVSAAEPLLRKGDRVLVLGDSSTQDGKYVVALDLLVRTRMPDAAVEIISLGLASETVSGASENHHPWPRPDVHERAGRALEKVKP